jgi:hypothetical protein
LEAGAELIANKRRCFSLLSGEGAMKHLSLDADIRAVCEQRAAGFLVTLAGRITIDSSPELRERPRYLLEVTRVLHLFDGAGEGSDRQRSDRGAIQR